MSNKMVSPKKEAFYQQNPVLITCANFKIRRKGCNDPLIDVSRCNRSREAKKLVLFLIGMYLIVKQILMTAT
jgi:hypothetical protein